MMAEKDADLARVEDTRQLPQLGEIPILGGVHPFMHAGEIDMRRHIVTGGDGVQGSIRVFHEDLFDRRQFHRLRLRSALGLTHRRRLAEARG